MQRKSLFASVAALAMVAACAVASSVKDVTVGLVAGSVLAVQLVFGAACFLPASVAQLVGLPVLSAKLERWGYVAHYKTTACLAQCRNILGGWLVSFMGYTGMLLYAFPQNVTADIAFGVVGELAFDGPCRAQPARINHGTAVDIVVGRWFTIAADGTARPGGAGSIGGIFMYPKNQASIGTAGGGSLAPTMTVPTGTVAEFCYMGAVVVQCTTAEAIGQAAWYDTTTGVIGAGAPGGGQAAIPNSKFIRYANAAAGLAVLELTN